MENDENKAADGAQTGAPLAGFRPAQDAEQVADRLDVGNGAGQEAVDGSSSITPERSVGIVGDGNDPGAAPNSDTVTPAHAGEASADLIDTTTVGQKTIASSEGSITLGAEIPGGVGALLGATNLTQQNTPMLASGRAKAILGSLATVESDLAMLERQKEDLRKDLQSALMDISPDLDEQKIVTPFGSASVMAGARRVKILNASAIPADLMKTVPDEKKIGDALRDGNVVNGAELGNGGAYTVRVTWPKKEG